jgi:hypothetical protein
VTLWDEARDDPTVGVRVRAECPDGQAATSPSVEIKPEGKSRVRSRIKSDGFLFGGEGKYLFHVEERIGDDDYRVVASLPLTLVLKREQAASDPV